MQTKSILVLLLSGSAAFAATSSSTRTSTSASPTGTLDCVAAQKLVMGIQENIQAQNEEIAALESVKQVVSTDPIDQNTFSQAKKRLQDTVSKSVSIRENNQKIAPKGNAAIAGLDKVAKAQQEEKSLSDGLKGNTDDMSAISKLNTDFMGGIQQNQQNIQDAFRGC
ncbi:hypothetical protein GQ53DRAFT_817005 [Thozetella sp. PMI_491]|nr:hypothetical protein GQ53DRAFT_817005 [Thozetella sp. PMI_491]